MIDSILDKARQGHRINREEACLLFKSPDILTIGNTANAIRNFKQPNSIVTYIIDRNINYSNICISGCLFCAFYRKNNHPEAYVLSGKEISEKICRSLRTIEGHRNNLLKKTGAKNTASLVVYAIYNDLVDIEVNVLKKSFLS